MNIQIQQITFDNDDDFLQLVDLQNTVYQHRNLHFSVEIPEIGAII